MEAQRFPDDYDGIISGAPANDWTHLISAGLSFLQAMTRTPDSYIPDRKVPAISAAVLQACDSEDGLADGILNDPPTCHFDPAQLVCHGPDSDTCLSNAQVAALRKIYSGLSDAAGRHIFPGLEPGGEDGEGGWKPWVTGSAPANSAGAAFVLNFFRYMVFSDPSWDYHTANVELALQEANQKTASILNATDPNLRAFQKRGAKLILYHGWSDPAIPPQNTIDYYNEVVSVLGQEITTSFVRLYMVPGMQHCAGGPGPSFFGQYGSAISHDAEHDIQQALDQWVERGISPGSLIAVKYNKGADPASGIAASRPLCPYPQIVKYTGSGDLTKASSFVCATR
jgi:hypothetical protein